jgi:hypothetical protein
MYEVRVEQGPPFPKGQAPNPHFHAAIWLRLDDILREGGSALE